MSEWSSDGHIESKGSELCLSCGLCCKGIIFNRAALKPDELKFAKGTGLNYFTERKGKYAFRLPCHLYRNGRCSAYLNRLDACKRYQCKLLKRLMKGEIDIEESRMIILQAKSLMSLIDKQIDDTETSTDFRQKIARALDLQYKNITIYSCSGVLLKDIESFYVILHRFIEDRAN